MIREGTARLNQTFVSVQALTALRKTSVTSTGCQPAKQFPDQAPCQPLRILCAFHSRRVPQIHGLSAPESLNLSPKAVRHQRAIATQA